MPSDNVSNGDNDGDRHGSQGGDDNDEQGVVSQVYLPSRRGMSCFYFLSLFHRLTFPCSTATGYPTTVEALADVFGQDNFNVLLRRFLFDQDHLDDVDPPSSSDVSLEECPPFDCPISVYHSTMAVFYSPSDPCGTRGMRRESIRSTPCWRKGAPRHDTVFVKRDATIPGVRGLDVVRLLALFSFVWRGQYYPCALVRWFKHTAEEVDIGMGMWVVKPDNNDDGSPAVGIIHLDSVLRAAHLMPVFGDQFIPIGLTPDRTLDIFQSFYINKYIDYHAFELAS